jgi:molybdenum transport protein
LVEQASGVATAARRIVDAARAVAPDIAVECTRKSLPGTRAVAVRAVLAGGASMHRLGLSDTVLIFAEHAAFAGGWPAVCARIGALKRRHPGRAITAEAHTADDALALARASVDVVQVDKFAPDAVRALVEATRSLAPRPAIAAAGGINADNAAAYAATGCAALVTSSPYWARPADIRVTIEPA